MRKTVIILVFVVSTLALIGLCVVQRQQIQKLSAKCAEAKPAVISKAKVAPDVVALAPRETQENPTPPIAAAQDKDEEAVSRVEPPLAVADAVSMANTNAFVSTNDSPMAGIAEMMKNPGMRDMIRAQQKGQMDMMYGAFFKSLQLSAEDIEVLKAGLLDKHMALMNISLDMMNNGMTPEERKAAANKVAETTAQYDAWIKAYLGDEDYAVYQSFEKTQPERMQVNLFKGALGIDEQLTEEQENTLIWAMNEERSKFKPSAGFEDMQSADFSQLTPERIAKLLEESAKLQAQYVSRAAAILTPSQLELFKANQKQQQAMQEMGMKMAAKMFGQSSKNAPANSP